MKKIGLDHGKDVYTFSEISPLVNYDDILLVDDDEDFI